MYRNLSQAIAPIQNDDIMIGKSCPALTNLHKRALIVLSPNGQWPSAAMYRVSGQVKLHKKKSETAKANMKAFLGSVQGNLSRGIVNCSVVAQSELQVRLKVLAKSV